MALILFRGLRLSITGIPRRPSGPWGFLVKRSSSPASPPHLRFFFERVGCHVLNDSPLKVCKVVALFLEGAADSPFAYPQVSRNANLAFT